MSDVACRPYDRQLRWQKQQKRFDCVQARNAAFLESAVVNNITMQFFGEILPLSEDGC
jgi:hypothetical protein